MSRRRLLLISRWRLETSRECLWQLLADPTGWPQWWPHVATVRRVANGDVNGVGTGYAFRWRSGLGYAIRIVMTTRRADALRELEGTANGDLSGIGLWIIEDDTPGALRLTYRWDVELARPWMRWLAPLLRPVFARRHFAVMAGGAAGMARALACRVSDIEEWSAISPVPEAARSRRAVVRRRLSA